MRIRGVRICEPDCPNRSPECHGKCEKYLKFHQERRAANEERMKQIEISHFTDLSVKRTQAGYFNSVARYRPNKEK